MSLLKSLGQLLTPLSEHLPDITYNPNQNSNIPFSTHNQALAQFIASHRPHSAQPIGHPQQMHLNTQGGLQMQQDAGGYGQPMQGGGPLNGTEPGAIQGQTFARMPQLPQGGQFNPGANPLQDRRPVHYNQAPQQPYSFF